MEIKEEITLSELKKEKDVFLVDMRDEAAFSYGSIPGAVNIYEKDIAEELLPKGRHIVFYCKSGIVSLPLAERLIEKGFNASSLKGGYMAWLREKLVPSDSKAAEVEKSIRKEFHRSLFSKFAQAINLYGLVEENDKIAVCISGGKDSMLMAKLFQELKRHNKFNFELVFLVMDPGYSKENREIIEHNAKILGVPVTIFESDIFDAVYSIEKSPCYICARMRRGHLYAKAKESGCNKIALGHHYDDVIETILMGMLYGAQIQTMMPKLHSTNFEGMELIRPLYYIREEDIIAWREENGLNFLRCACRLTEAAETDESASKRQEVKRLIRELKKTNPAVEAHIFKSVENVSLDTVIAYKTKGKRVHFLDDYDKQA